MTCGRTCDSPISNGLNFTWVKQVFYLRVFPNKTTLFPIPQPLVCFQKSPHFTKRFYNVFPSVESSNSLRWLLLDSEWLCKFTMRASQLGDWRAQRHTTNSWTRCTPLRGFSAPAPVATRVAGRSPSVVEPSKQCATEKIKGRSSQLLWFFLFEDFEVGVLFSRYSCQT